MITVHKPSGNDIFWAQLTAYDGTRYYTWQEVVPDPVATFVPLVGGRSGTNILNPAYVPNGAVISVPSFVRLQLAYWDTTGLDWTYAVAATSGGSGLEIIGAADGTPEIFPAPAKLYINQATMVTKNEGDGNPTIYPIHVTSIVSNVAGLLIPEGLNLNNNIGWKQVTFDTILFDGKVEGDVTRKLYSPLANGFIPWLEGLYYVDFDATIGFGGGLGSGFRGPVCIGISLSPPGFTVPVPQEAIQSTFFFDNNKNIPAMNVHVGTVLLLTGGQSQIIRFYAGHSVLATNGSPTTISLFGANPSKGAQAKITYLGPVDSTFIP